MKGEEVEGDEQEEEVRQLEEPAAQIPDVPHLFANLN